MAKKWKILIGVVVVIGLAIMIQGSISSKDRNAPKVTTAKVDKVDLVAKVTANGKIQAHTKVDLSALVMGQIVNLAVKEGDQVKRGQLLLQIDKAQLAAGVAGREASMSAMRNDLQAARATAAQAKSDYERAKQNYNAKILAEADFQKAKSNWDTAEANVQATSERLNMSGADLAASRDSLSKTTVLAPIAGVVTALPVKEGEVTVIGTMNNAGTQLLTISDMSEVEAVMMVDETSVPSVKIGQIASLSVDAYPGRNFKGVVTEVGSSPIQKNDPDLLSLTANSEAINFKVRIKLTEPPATVRPGFSVTAEIETGRKDGTTAIPIQALVVRDVPRKKDDKKPATGRPATEEGVYLVNKGKLDFAKVETGIAGELMIEVKTGVKLGDEIVTGPFKTLRQVKEGDRVVIENEKDKDKGEQGKGPKAS
jgi:HlyD family secretion protein